MLNYSFKRHMTSVSLRGSKHFGKSSFVSSFMPTRHRAIAGKQAVLKNCSLNVAEILTPTPETFPYHLGCSDKSCTLHLIAKTENHNL